MAEAYAELADLKQALKITDAGRDALLLKALAAASRSIDAATGRPAGGFFAADTASARVFNPRGRLVYRDDGELLLVDEISTLADLAVKVGGAGTSWATASTVTDYETSPDNALALGEPVTGLLRPAGCWAASPTTRIQVTARWGWPAVPDAVAQATLLQAARLFRRKDSPEGVTGNAEWGVVRVARIDPDVQALTQHLVLPAIA